MYVSGWTISPELRPSLCVDGQNENRVIPTSSEELGALGRLAAALDAICKRPDSTYTSPPSRPYSRTVVLGSVLS